MTHVILCWSTNDSLKSTGLLRFSGEDNSVCHRWFQVVNFYFNLLQDRSGQEGLPSIYVFNTFFYPTLMKFGHSRLKRWTKQVDIFSKDFVLVPVHLGMHWCLAVSEETTLGRFAVIAIRLVTQSRCLYSRSVSVTRPSPTMTPWAAPITPA